MPITQERMLTCINAGLSAFNALTLAQQILSEQIINIKNHIPNKETNIISVLETLQILLMPEALVNTAGPMSYIEAWHQLQMEARHFREFKSTNLRAKRYQQRKRGKTQINRIESLYQQTQDDLLQKAKDKMKRMQKPQNIQNENQTDYRNYQPEDFE